VRLQQGGAQRAQPFGEPRKTGRGIQRALAGQPEGLVFSNVVTAKGNVQTFHVAFLASPGTARVFVFSLPAGGCVCKPEIESWLAAAPKERAGSNAGLWGGCACQPPEQPGGQFEAQ